MNILILQPYRPSTPAALMDRAGVLTNALVAAHPEHAFIVDRRPGIARQGIGPEKYAPHADVRNQIVEGLTSWPDYVLWIDVDLIDYPVDFVRKAMTVNPGGVTAPIVILEGTSIFYDIGGFIEPGGRPVYPHPPYVRQPWPIWELESVGCMYLAPAQIYRDGARYAPNGPVYGVEHWNALRGCRRRIICDTSLVATHAYGPRWGEEIH